MPAPNRLASVRTKSVYEPAAPEDGLRVLVTRYWPRGVSRSAVDEYVRALAPSEELLRAFKDGTLAWEAFRQRYVEQMAAPEAREEIERLADEAASRPVTLMCVCREEGRCHRTPLRELVSGETAELE